MCDCYSAPCSGGCGTTISLHIGDFSTDRESVEAYCPFCTRKLAKQHKRGKKAVWPQVIDEKYVHTDYGRWNESAQVWETAEPGEGEEVVLLCSDKAGYGIHFN